VFVTNTSKEFAILSDSLKWKISSLEGESFQEFFGNLMLDIYKNDYEKMPTKRGDEGNDGYIKSIGKFFALYSPIIELIHFCLGSKTKGDWCEKLSDVDFYLDFINDGENFKIKRNTKNKNKIYLNEKEFKINDFTFIEFARYFY
jgi:hypothetical protein